MNDAKEFRHPSYGVLTLTRFSSSESNPLFGSVVNSRNGLSLSISRAYVRHSLGSDSIFGEEEVIQVRMTEEQLGRMLSSIGVGEGIPCTIAHLNGKFVPEPPLLETEQKRIYDDFSGTMNDIAKDLRGHLPEIMAILDKDGAINKAEREVIRKAMGHIHMELKNNATFALQQFQESAERVIEAAKVEVNTHAMSVSRKLGLPEPVQHIVKLTTGEQG
jgi:hypothetical protein